MALSDELSKLSVRAKEAEQHAAAARGKARADLEKDVETARMSAQTEAERLRDTAEAREGRISAWWDDVQRTWNEHVEELRARVGAKKAERDVEKAETKAERAEDDADFAVSFAYAAITEAEYAVLDAALARKEADELVGAR